MNNIIFDLDGTLLDSMWVWDNLDSELLALYGGQATPETRAAMRVMSVKESAEYIANLFGKADADEVLSTMQSLGQEKYKAHVTIKPHVLEFLRLLKSRGTKMCIATASPRQLVLHTLHRLGIDEFFEFIIAGDDIATGKENPEIYLKCAERLGADPADITVFEDAPHAVKTAKAAGFRVVGVFDEAFREYTDEIKAICDQYICGFDEVM